jgi:hypothetical protein
MRSPEKIRIKGGVRWQVRFENACAAAQAVPRLPYAREPRYAFRGTSVACWASHAVIQGNTCVAGMGRATR